MESVDEMTDYSGTKVNFFGPLGAATGYVGHYVGLIRGLAELGVDVTPFPDNLQALREKELEDIAKLIQEKLPKMDFSAPGVGLAYGTAFDMFRFAGKPRIGYTTIEVNKLPADWPAALNQMDAVWAPTTYNKKVFEESGISKPVAVVKEPVNADLFNPYSYKPFPVIEQLDTFNFLCVGKWEKRKGYDLLLKAWAKAFKPGEKVNLFLLCHNPFVRVDVGMELYKMQLPSHIPIETIEPLPTAALMAQLYCSMDAFVWGTRAEGFGRPVLEAMACGLPVISPSHTGMADFFDADVGFVVESEGLEKANDPIFGNTINQGEWEMPSIKSLAEQMRYVFDNHEEAAKKGSLARRRVEEAWTQKEAAKQFVAELEKVKA